MTTRACERSGAVSGVQKIKWSGAGAGGRRSGERAKSAAQNPLHHKTNQSKKFKIDFKSYNDTLSVNSLPLCSLCRE